MTGSAGKDGTSLVAEAEYCLDVGQMQTDRLGVWSYRPVPGAIMAIKTIFLPVFANAVSDSGLAVACELAHKHDAHLVAVICISALEPLAASFSCPPMTPYQGLIDAAKRAGSKTSTQLSTELAKAGVSHEVHVADTLWLTVSEMAAVHARYSDLTVFARIPGFDVRMEGRFFGDLLLQSGRPLLLVPSQGITTTSGIAAVAWKPSREATRALHDALPLLAKATSVRIVAVDPKVEDVQHGQLPGADIAKSLARHGLKVEVVECPRMGESAGMAILRQAREQGAGLLVAGGYGHRRAHERVFGGVTRTLFEKADLPVLFSH